MGAIVAVPLNVSTLFAQAAHQWTQSLKDTFAEHPKARRAVMTSAAVIAGLFFLKRVSAAHST